MFINQILSLEPLVADDFS